jgi:hypothetical protein
LFVRLPVWPVSALIASLCTTATAVAEPAPLRGEALRSIVPGAHIELDTPLKTVVPIRFSPDGLMTGEANGLGTYLGSDRDRGRWRIAGDQLCLKWFRWFDAEERCLNLRRDEQRIYWDESGGENGTATLVTSGEEVAKATTRFALAAAGGVEQKTDPLTPAPAQGSASNDKTPAEPVAATPPPTPAPDGATAPAVAVAPVAANLSNLTIISRAEAATPPPALAAPAAQPAAPDAAAPPNQAAPTAPKKPSVARAQPKRADKAAAAKDRAVKRPTRVSSAEPVNQPTYQVAHVDEDDVLNIRNGPSEEHETIGEIPPDGRGVRMVGPCQTDWCPVAHGSAKGWVHRYYLEAEGEAKPTAALTRRTR